MTIVKGIGWSVIESKASKEELDEFKRCTVSKCIIPRKVLIDEELLHPYLQIKLKQYLNMMV
jgi:hypothetical protein